MGNKQRRVCKAAFADFMQKNEMYDSAISNHSSLRETYNKSKNSLNENCSEAQTRALKFHRLASRDNLTLHKRASAHQLAAEETIKHETLSKELTALTVKLQTASENRLKRLRDYNEAKQVTLDAF